jgi:hypothetical protein
MKSHLFIILNLSFLLISNISLAQNSSKDLLGSWQSVDVKDQVGYQIEFRSNHEFIYKKVLIADYKYKIKGNMLITSLQKDNPAKKIIIDTSYLIFKKDTVLRAYNRLGWKDTSVMIRDKSYRVKKTSKSNSIIGRWISYYPTGDTAISIFNDNNVWHFTVPQESINGKYSIKGDSLIVSYNNNKKNQINTFWIEGKLLELKELGTGKQILYRKIK